MLTRMQICCLWLLISFGNHALAATDCAMQTDIPQSQCQALVDLYHSTDGANWSIDGGDWNVTNAPCSWTRVTCSGNVVTEINLYSSHLTGTLPNSLVNLTGLTYLGLSGNQLTGTIPTLPTGLTWLDLSFNQLTGTIPTLPIGLIGLNLFFNQLTETIPTLPTGLTGLGLSHNQLTGTIPTLPTGLTGLYLSYNQLTGTIPTLPTGLTGLYLSHNQLTGTIPTLPTGLIRLDLSYNQLSGIVPDLPLGLTYMNLRGNQQLEKTNCATQTDIPQSQCQALVDLYNSAGGENWFNTIFSTLNFMENSSYSVLYNWNVTNTPCSWTGVTCNGNVVTKIILFYSDLTGMLPNSLVNLTGLTELDLHNNQLTGTIPTLPIEAV